MWLRDLHTELEELDSAEAFMEWFGVDYDPHTVSVYRLHILKRFHDYIQAEAPPQEPEAALARAAALLRQAHDDFVGSDARTQAALRVYQQPPGGGQAAIPVAQIQRRRLH
ncbi:nitrogenase-stabilizing/protective protein NifW [Halorhodospira neutriphila]|uniref:Nitrogenase-stabilizing/protective protein NifW n=1 Tax=Halorhodospira neutriphila TaxID=168379 RepID=A0ABS1E443_9GAMM|nr:nitrogenase-stabilizing/protective protein NifW [Halorhodospira neutriphila]MBK1726498.1 hypothetical protein [Halorhodospira neutriphila]